MIPPPLALPEVKYPMKMCLVVDDSEVVRKVACRIVEDLDFIPLEAENGQQALEQCQNDMPDAIILDWQMPVMDGIEFLTALQDERDGDRAKIFYCTTEHDAGHITRALNTGATDFLLKPYDFKLVQEKFRTAGLI